MNPAQMVRNGAFILPNVKGKIRDIEIELSPECRTEILSHISREVFIKGRISHETRADLVQNFLDYIISEESKALEIHGSTSINPIYKSSEGAISPETESFPKDSRKMNLEFPKKRSLSNEIGRVSSPRKSSLKIKRLATNQSFCRTSGGMYIPKTPRTAPGINLGRYFDPDKPNIVNISEESLLSLSDMQTI